MVTENLHKTIVSNMIGGGVQLTDYTGKTVSSVGRYPELSLNGGSYPHVASMRYMIQGYTGSNGGVVIGNGTAEPTAEDYSLSGSIITGYSYIANYNRNITDDGVSVTATYTITNNNEEAITVSEIGLLAAYDNNAYVNKVLLERSLLETPITIEPGGVGKVTYTIAMNYLTE